MGGDLSTIFQSQVGSDLTGGQQVAAGDQIRVDLNDLESDSERETVAEMSSCPSFAYVVAVHVFCSIASRSTNHQMWEDKKKRIKGMQKKQVYVLFKKERNQIFVLFFLKKKTFDEEGRAYSAFSVLKEWNFHFPST